jgi:hypothetical protein
MSRRPLIERYEPKVDRSGGPDACWIWTAGTDGRGYGWIHDGEKMQLAHRVAVVFDGRDPSGFVVCHTCDNPRCVNPAHLFLGTQGDNMRDKVAKGRNPYKVRRLTASDAAAVLERKANGETHAAIAEAFGISESHVTNICCGRAWKHALAGAAAQGGAA